MLSSTNSAEIMVTLEERCKEVDLLRRRLQICEKEKETLSRELKQIHEAKLPPDVRMLAAQKRELQTQLEREESEKHELFAQINQLIGETAKLQNAVDILGEKENIIKSLEKQLETTQIELEENKISMMRKDREFQFKIDELKRLKDEWDHKEKTLKSENARLVDDLRSAQQKIDKTHDSVPPVLLENRESENGLLNEKISALEQELCEKDDLLSELTESNDELSRAITDTSKQLEQIQNEYENAKKKWNEEKCILKSSEADLIKKIDLLKSTDSINLQNSNEEEIKQLKGMLLKETASREKAEELLKSKIMELKEFEIKIEENATKAETMDEKQKEKIHLLEELIKEYESNGTELQKKLLDKEKLFVETNAALKNYEDILKQLQNERIDLLRRIETYQRDKHENDAKLNASLESNQLDRLKERRSFEENELKLNQAIDELQSRLNIELQKRSEIESSSSSQIQELKKQINSLQNQLSEEKRKSNCLEKNDGEISLLKNKIVDLTNENTRLSADLLEQQINSEKEFRHLLAKEREEFHERIAQKDQELSELAKKLKSIMTSQNELPNGQQQPVAKPRRQPQMNGGTSSNNDHSFSLADASTETDHISDDEGTTTTMEKLSHEFEKQKRIITVLRKKLQKRMIEEHRREISINKETRAADE